MPQPTPKPLPLDPENPYVLVPLHQYPEFTFPCATLLNMEWPRSRQARLNSLWSCSKNFPVALVLVRSNDRQAVGFGKVSLIPNVKHACFVESVVVHPDSRGKGLGSLLMRKLEDYVISRKLSSVYLSTLGQENFYKKLGYHECDPVSLYAFGLSSNPRPHSNENSENGVIALHGVSPKVNGHDSWNGNKPLNNNNSIQKNIIDTNVREPKCAPPPPPPLPSMPIGVSVMTVKTYMKKELSIS